MVKSSIKKNYILNLINTLTGLVFPLITFPYASRILFAEGIGQVQFFQSIIDYIALCSALGIPLYAVREIARNRDNVPTRSKTTIEVLLLHVLLTFAGYIIVAILAVTIKKIEVNIPLFLLLSTTLLFNTIGVNWFYQAVEDFKYITIRSLVIRLFSLIALFLFVKTPNDLLYYAGITVIVNVGGNIFNFIRLRKFIQPNSFSFREISLARHLKPALQIFILNLTISIYVNLDSVMLGFIKSEEAVGYYTAATKLTKAILGIISSLGLVLLPRFSNMISNGEFTEFKSLANKVISFTIALSLPLSIGLIFMSPILINLFCGKDFAPSILTLQLIAPIILFIGLSGIIGMQILYPQGKEKIVILATTCGAFINFTLNLLLIPRYSQYGAAIATTFAELTVVTAVIFFGRQMLPVHFLSKQNLHYVIGSILIALCLCLIQYVHLPDIYELITGILISGLVYGFYLYLNKDIFIIQTIDTIKSIITKRFQHE